MSLAEKVMTLVPVEDAFCQVFDVARENLVNTVRTLKEEHGVNMIIDCTAVEYEEDLCGIYHFMCEESFELIRLRVHLDKEDLHLPSICDIFPACNQMEREAYDLFGIIYDGHPNLTRILCAEDFEGHPLRKDYVSNTRD